MCWVLNHDFAHFTFDYVFCQLVEIQAACISNVSSGWRLLWNSYSKTTEMKWTSNRQLDELPYFRKTRRSGRLLSDYQHSIMNKRKQNPWCGDVCRVLSLLGGQLHSCKAFGWLQFLWSMPDLQAGMVDTAWNWGISKAHECPFGQREGQHHELEAWS